MSEQRDDNPGYFVDWDGNLRSVEDPGGGYHCEVDRPARYVGVKTKAGSLVHEATFYRDLQTVEKKGISAKLVPGSHPWGERGSD